MPSSRTEERVVVRHTLAPVCGLILLLAAVPADAQSIFVTCESATGFGGEEVVVSVHAVSDRRVDAGAVGILHDPSVASVVSVEPGAALEALNAGTGPDTFGANFSFPGINGLNAFFVEFAPSPDVLLPQVSYELFRITYQLTIGPDVTAPLTFADLAPSPAVENEFLLDNLAGSSVEVLATTTDGNITRLDPRPVTLSVVAESVGIRSSTATVEVHAEHRRAIEGFGFGIAHDPTALEVIDVTPGDAFPSPPFFFGPLLGSDGFSVGAVSDFPPTSQYIPASDDSELIVITYSVLPAADEIEPLTFSSTVGAGVLTEVTLEGLLLGDLTLIEGALRTAAAATFIRGDANGDGTLGLVDAVVSFSYLFEGNPTPCAQSLDVDDSGQVTVSDVFAMLAYLFSGGSPPAGPFPACGTDADLSPLACDVPPLSCP